MKRFQNFRQEIKDLVRGYKLLWQIDRDMLIYMPIRALLNIVSPYTTMYLSARILTGIAAGESFRRLIVYAALIVGIGFLMSILSRLVSRRISISQQNFWYNQECFFSRVNMKMQYSHLENPATYKLKDLIYQAENANGFGLMTLMWQIEGGINAVSSILLSAALTVSLFTLKAPGEFHGIWAFLNSPVSAVVILGLILLNLFVNTYSAKKTQAVYFREMENLANDNRLSMFYINSLLDYHIAAEIRIFNEAPLIEKRWLSPYLRLEYIHRLTKVRCRLSRLGSTVSFLMNLTLYLLVGAKAYMGAFGIGNLVLYTGTVRRFISAVTSLFDIVVTLKNNNVYMRRVFAYLDMPNTMYEGTLPVEKRAFCDGGDIDYEIEFRDVSFRYPASDRYALRHVNIRFRVGERLAIVGQNGSGKTTFIKLLCRLYDPTEGEILLNGINIKSFDYEEYLRLFSVVFQDFELFSFPIAQNVAASLHYDGEKVERCLREVGFGERLRELPEGIETCLFKNFDPKGVEVSGGEAQKIALARALYKDAPFIILDEPTAALDPMAEQEIYSRFGALVKGKTAVFISHRLSFCRFCDDVAVFDEGRIVQHGTHEALVADADGKYASLWNAQAQYYQKDRDPE